MAYCPKCGVELDASIQNCPLCSFPIPDLGEREKAEANQMTNKYPNAIIRNRKDYRIIKNNIFFASLLIVISAIIILGIIKTIYPMSTTLVNYGLIIIIALLFYIFFTFGYLKFRYNSIGFVLTTLFLTYSIDYQNGELEWFITYALPIVIILYIDITIFRILSKTSQKKNQFVYVPTLSLLFISILCLGIDGVISINLKARLSFSWSIIVFICAVIIGLVFLGTYHGLSNESKAWLKKKLHV